MVTNRPYTQFMTQLFMSISNNDSDRCEKEYKKYKPVHSYHIPFINIACYLSYEGEGESSRYSECNKSSRSKCVHRRRTGFLLDLGRSNIEEFGNGEEVGSC